MRALIGLAIVMATSLAVISTARAEDKVLLRSPELVVQHGPSSETCAFPAAGYSAFKLDGLTATFTLEGQALPAGSRKLAGGGISQVSWTPGDKSTQVTVNFATAPDSTLLNAVPGTKDRPQTAQVLAGFLFKAGTLADERHGPQSMLGSHDAEDTVPASERSDRQPGTYKIPEFPTTHYSDALVTLKVQNADFRDILFLMGRIGNVSIMLDPYYNDPPTGSKRSDKSGGSGGQGQGSGTQGGGNGLPGRGPGQIPQDNTGFVTLNFKDIPFDQALDLLLQSSGLVKADVYPNSPLAQ